MRLISILFFLALILISSCSVPVAIVEPRRADREVLTEEIQNGLPARMTLHEGSGFYYGFEYDRNNLYLRLATSDPEVKTKIAYFGLTVWIDREGDKNKVQGFTFPKAAKIPTASQSSTRRSGTGRPAEGITISSVLRRAEEIDLIGIYGTSVRTVKMRDSRIRAETGLVEDFLVYEATIPFEMLEYGYDPGRSGTGISVGLETGHLEMPRSSDRQRPPQGRTGGDGMRRPGGMTGQYPGQYPGRIPDRSMMDQRPSDINKLSRPTRLWLTLEFER